MFIADYEVACDNIPINLEYRIMLWNGKPK